MAIAKKAAPKQEVKTVACTAPGGVNIRKEGKKSADFLGIIKCDEKVYVTSTARGWHKIAKGYVMAKFFE